MNIQQVSVANLAARRPAVVDDPEDNLRAARGIMFASVLGLAMWVVGICLVKFIHG